MIESEDFHMHKVCYVIIVSSDCQTDYDRSDSWCIAVAGNMERAIEFVRGIDVDDPIYTDGVDEGIRIISDEMPCDLPHGTLRSIHYKDKYDEWNARFYIREMEYLL